MDELKPVCARVYNRAQSLVGTKVLALTHPDQPPVRGTIMEALDSTMGNDLVLCQLVRVDYEAGGSARYQLFGMYSKMRGEVFWDPDQPPAEAPENPWKQTHMERECSNTQGGVNMGDGRWRGYGGITSVFDRKPGDP